MTERLDRIETNLEILGDRVGQLAQEVSDLRHSTSDLRESVSDLRQEMRQSASDLRQEMRQSASDLRQDLKTSIETANEARREDIQVMVGIVDTLSDSIRGLRETQMTMIQQSNSDRAAWQSEIQRMWEYLMRQSSNGHGE